MKNYPTSAAVTIHVMASTVSLLLAAAAVGQTTNNALTLPAEPSTNPWSFNASAYGYLIPDSRDYINLNFAADHDRLHFEARYNYEALETGSLWVGYKFTTGQTLVFEFGPMLGGVFGNLTGVAPGYNLLLSYKRFELSSQGEYYFDAGESSENFFYTWSELTYSPLEWLRAGLVIQRTKAYKTELDIQRGFLVGVAFKRVDVTGYVFNLGWTDPTFVMSIGFSF